MSDELSKPPHWPTQVDRVADDHEQTAVRVLAHVRKMIVDYRKDECEEDWRTAHAQSSNLVNVVGGLIADCQATDKHWRSLEREVGPLRERIKELKEQLAESKRPFSAQMEMQNRRIVALTAEVDRLTIAALIKEPK